ncbi:MAG TPA: hypothetical protein VFH58_11265 [Acidimicrobiales bacterium]|nr:hypothetical protein [Acidimicrobiales bacterium]
MATLSFEGETQDEIVTKVRRWLRSVESSGDRIEPTEAVERLSDLVKDGLGVVAAAAPRAVAENELVKGLTELGYRVTDQTGEAVISGINAVADISGERIVGRVRHAGHVAAYRMETTIAREVLRALRL